MDTETRMGRTRRVTLYFTDDEMLLFDDLSGLNKTTDWIRMQLMDRVHQLDQYRCTKSYQKFHETPDAGL